MKKILFIAFIAISATACKKSSVIPMLDNDPGNEVIIQVEFTSPEGTLFSNTALIRR